MKKNCFYVSSLVFLLFTTANSASLKSFFSSKTTRKPLTPTEQLLATMKTFIEQKKAEKIAKLKTKENPKKREKAKILEEERTRLDHIKIITEDHTIYLQLENSAHRIWDAHHYPFNAKELEEKLQQLLENNIIQIKQDTQADIYKSEKLRRHPLFGGLYPQDDLYSAAIFLGTEKAPHRRRDIRRHFRRYNQEQD